LCTPGENTLTYQDHFAENSSQYLEHRPQYPDELFDFITSLVPEKTLVWDCGTGNGQAALALAQRFKQVVASDINQAQLDVAPQKANIEYHCWPAEKTALLDNSVDLITVAQALHWFDLEKFYQEVKRVAKPAGVIAVWCYSLGKISPAIDKIYRDFYFNIVGEYWPMERRYIDEKYQTILFPFTRVPTPQFTLQKELTLQQLIGYLNTWSVVKSYQKQHHANPIDLIYRQLVSAWGSSNDKKIMQWPVHLICGKILPSI